MSILDNRQISKQLDQHNYLSHILEAPTQLSEGFDLGMGSTISAGLVQAKQVVIATSGEMEALGQAIVALTLTTSKVPVVIVNDYVLPHWVGSETLVLALDYYGSNDQVIRVYQEAATRKARLLSVSVGGVLSRESRRFRAHHITLRYGALARVAFFYTLGVVIAIAKKLDLLEIKESTVTEAIVLSRTLLENINPEVAQYQNNAKQLAQKIVTHPTTIVGSGPLFSVASKWGVSCGATGKASVRIMSLSDFSATMLNGLSGLGKQTQMPFVVMLQSKYDHQRNKVIQTLVYQVAQAQKIAYEQIFMHPSGSLFGEIVLSSLLGEMVGYYLAMLGSRDPSETLATDYLFDALTAEQSNQ